MSYEQKLNKYKNKLLFKKQLGGKDCDIIRANDTLATTYIKDITNFIPFEKSIFHPYRVHPVCSYSIWDESHIQLYVPTPPEEKDKLYPTQPFYVRLHMVYFKSQDPKDLNGEGAEFHMIMWSTVHKKWYELDIWPLNDPLLDQLLRFFKQPSPKELKVIINNFFMFRKPNVNIQDLSENVRLITDMIYDNDDGNISPELQAELERYSPQNEEVVNYDDDDPPRFK